MYWFIIKKHLKLDNTSQFCRFLNNILQSYKFFNYEISNENNSYVLLHYKLDSVLAKFGYQRFSEGFLRSPPCISNYCILLLVYISLKSLFPEENLILLSIRRRRWRILCHIRVYDAHFCECSTQGLKPAFLLLSFRPEMSKPTPLPLTKFWASPP